MKKKLKKNSNFFLPITPPRPPLSVHKKFQPSRSSRLAGYRQHIFFILNGFRRVFEISITESILKRLETLLLTYLLTLTSVWLEDWLGMDPWKRNGVFQGCIVSPTLFRENGVLQGCIVSLTLFQLNYRGMGLGRR